MTFTRPSPSVERRHEVFFGLFSAQHEIEKKLEDYLRQTEDIVWDLQRGVETYVNGDQQAFSRLFNRINTAEHNLDTLRRDIEEEVYGRRLLPDTRSDLLGLLESVDRIPNRIQALTRDLALQKIQVPQRLQASLNRLAEIDVKIIQVLTQTVRIFLDKPDQVKQKTKELSDYEHEGDGIEQHALALTFDDGSLELAHKLQLRRLIDELGSICDMAEDVGDQLVIAALKRIL